LSGSATDVLRTGLRLMVVGLALRVWAVRSRNRG